MWSAPAERSVDGALDCRTYGNGIGYPKRCRAATTPARLPRRGPRCLPPHSKFCRPLRGLNDLIGGLVPGEAGRAVPASLQTST